MYVCGIGIGLPYAAAPAAWRGAQGCHPTDEDLSEETPAWGDGGYQGQTGVIRQAPPHAQDMTCRRTKYKNRDSDVDFVSLATNTTAIAVNRYQRSMIPFSPVSSFSYTPTQKHY